MLALRPTPTVLRPDPALSSASAAFGSAAQTSAATWMGPSSAGLTHPFVSADPEDPLSFGVSVARATPWPYTDTVPGGQVVWGGHMFGDLWRISPTFGVMA